MHHVVIVGGGLGPSPPPPLPPCWAPAGRCTSHGAGVQGSCNGLVHTWLQLRAPAAAYAILQCVLCCHVKALAIWWVAQPLGHGVVTIVKSQQCFLD